TTEGEARDVAEGDWWPAVETVSAAIGASGADNQRVVAAGPVHGDAGQGVAGRLEAGRVRLAVGAGGPGGRGGDMVGRVDEVIVDRNAAGAVKDPDLRALGPRDGVAGDGRVCRIEEKDAVPVVADDVAGHGDIGLRLRLGRGEVHAGAAAPGECVAVDQDVGQGTAGGELVRVDAGAADRAGLVVVLKQVVLDHGLVARAVGQRQARDVVLDDIVQNVGPRGAGAEQDAKAELVGAGLVFDDEAVDGHVAGGYIEGRLATVAAGVEHRLASPRPAVLRVHAVL